MVPNPDPWLTPTLGHTDWAWVLRLCDPAVREDWDAGAAASRVFTAHQRAARSGMDAFTAKVIAEHSHSHSRRSNNYNSTSRSQQQTTSRAEVPHRRPSEQGWRAGPAAAPRRSDGPVRVYGRPPMVRGPIVHMGPYT